MEVRVCKSSLKNLSDTERRYFIVAAVPAFNEEKTIATIVLRAQRFVDKVVVCDDGSTDMTAEIAERLGADLIRHERNLGYGAALRSLFQRARDLCADAVVTLDGDGQHDPNEIPVLVEPVLEGKADVVIGSRLLDKAAKTNSIPRFRQLGIKAITKLTNAASHYRLSDAQSGFRAYGHKALEGLRLSENGMGASVEVLMQAKKMGLVIAETSTGCNYHGLETSSRVPLRHGGNVVMSIMRSLVEDKPLLLIGVPGVVSLLVGVLFGVWMLQIYALESRIVTNVALASMAFILIGLFALFTAITLYAILRLTQKLKE